MSEGRRRAAHLRGEARIAGAIKEQIFAAAAYIVSRSAKFALCLSFFVTITKRKKNNGGSKACITDYLPPIVLFLLMTVLSQTFFALVGSHLVAFSFLSAGHFRNALVG